MTNTPKTNEETDAAILALCDDEVKHRRKIELFIVRLLIEKMLAAKMELCACNGEESLTTQDPNALVENLFATDEGNLYVSGPNPNDERAPSLTSAFVTLVFGNDGWDVINDHSTSLSAILETIYQEIEQREDLDDLTSTYYPLDAKPVEDDDAKDDRIGAILADALGLKRDREYADRWQTSSWGTKTNRGLLRTIKSVIAEEEAR